MAKVSIVIRTFNSEKTIKRVLEAVGYQTYDDRELVIVDSGSTDETLSIVGEYPHTFVDYSKERFTYSGSLNAGCEVAQGEYLACLSHHCIPLHNDWLGSLVKALEEDRNLAGAWGPLIFDVSEYPVDKKGAETIDLEKFYQRPNWGLQNPNSIIRRVLWEERPFSEEVERCEDQDWIRHFLQRGYNSAIVHNAPVLYAPDFGFYQYAAGNYKNSLALDEIFGYRGWALSTSDLARQTVRLVGAAILGKKAPRVSRMAVSSGVGRWAADKVLRYREDPRKLYKEEAGEISRLSVSIVHRTRNEARKAGKKSVQRYIWQRARKANEQRNAAMQSNAARQTGMETRFFLVGEMRSGTSWLQKTLNSHPEVFCKGEGSFFGREQETEEIPVYTGPAPSLYNALAGNESLNTWHSLMWNGWAREDEKEEDLRNITRLAVNYFFLKDSAHNGKRIVGDKSPLHTDHVDEIHEFYPMAKVVHIYRDGRDVAVSLMHHFWRLSKDNGGIFELEPEELAIRDAYLADPEGFLSSGRSIFTEERLRQMAVRWGRRVDKASAEGRELLGDNYIELSYEELLQEPMENVKKLLEFLGAQADEKSVKRCVEQNRFENLARRSVGKEDSGSFFRKGVAGDWRSVFTDRDLRIYEEMAEETLQKMGYKVD